MAWSLTEPWLVDRIHIHFWALHQTKLCNCNLLSPWGKYRYSRKIASKLGRVDVRRAALEVPCRRRRTQSSTALGRAPCYPILSFSCTPWIPMPPFIITCSLSAIHLNWGVPDPWWRGHAQTQNCTCTNICSTVDVPLAATLKNILYNACYVWEEPLIDFHPTIT